MRSIMQATEHAFEFRVRDRKETKLMNDVRTISALSWVTDSRELSSSLITDQIAPLAERIFEERNQLLIA